MSGQCDDLLALRLSSDLLHELSLEPSFRVHLPHDGGEPLPLLAAPAVPSLHGLPDRVGQLRLAKVLVQGEVGVQLLEDRGAVLSHGEAQAAVNVGRAGQVHDDVDPGEEVAAAVRVARAKRGTAGGGPALLDRDGRRNVAGFYQPV